MKMWKKLVKDIERIQIENNEFIISHYKSLSDHIQIFPSCTIIDIYKFLYQRYFGWGHLLVSKSSDNVYRGLQTEFNEEQISKSFTEPLFELLNENTNLGRIHIRPWKFKYKGTVDQLWKMMLNVKIMEDRGFNSFLKELNEIFSTFTGEMKILDDFIESLLNKVNQARIREDIPLFHHSALFRKEYLPSYRLVFETSLPLGFLKK